MRRHPCILDQGADFFTRHRWLAPVGVACVLLIAVALGSWAAWSLKLDSWHLGVVYTFVTMLFLMFFMSCYRSSGMTPRCTDETRVIQLIHGWPASSHHYGLHA